MDWELIWWCAIGVVELVFIVLALLVRPKSKRKDDITILRIGR